MPEVDAELRDAGEAVARLAAREMWVVAAAESVTAGGIGTALAAAPEASEWFAGSMVAYRTETKRRVLGVTAERIISADCAVQLAEGVLRLTRADAAVAVTGVGGPDEEEGRPPGTVFIAAGNRDAIEVAEHRFAGDAAQVVRDATLAAVRMLAGVA